MYSTKEEVTYSSVSIPSTLFLLHDCKGDWPAGGDYLKLSPRALALTIILAYIHRSGLLGNDA